MFHSNQCTLVWPILCTKAMRYHWRVESHNAIIESSTIPNPKGVNNSRPETKETKKSQEAFTEKGGHTQMIQMIPDSPPYPWNVLHPNPNFLSEDSCWCRRQTATNEPLAECSKWFDIVFKRWETLIISRHCLCWIDYMPSWCYSYK